MIENNYYKEKTTSVVVLVIEEQKDGVLVKEVYPSEYLYYYIHNQKFKNFFLSKIHNTKLWKIINENNS